MTFSLSMHPASEGDALELKWGDDCRALIDLGRKGDYARLSANGIVSGEVDLFVMTHVDADHIEGAVPMAGSPAAPFHPKQVWFNGSHHPRNAKHRMDGDSERETLSVEQGERLSHGIKRFRWAWNSTFASGVASTDSPEASRLEIAGLEIRLLSPTDQKLSKLEPKWRRLGCFAIRPTMATPRST
jgi:beta-lactamase superfamily II metal-dependent hydrolase